MRFHFVGIEEKKGGGFGIRYVYTLFYRNEFFL